VFHDDAAITMPRVFGVLSLIVWALTIIATIKYIIVLMRTDNRGEGGIFALTILVRRLLAGETVSSSRPFRVAQARLALRPAEPNTTVTVAAVGEIPGLGRALADHPPAGRDTPGRPTRGFRASACSNNRVCARRADRRQTGNRVSVTATP
jgi:hypothetical protein